MRLEAFLTVLKDNKISFCINEAMREHTTFRIGGCADVLVAPVNIIQLKTVLAAAKENEVPCVCLGRGSNLLVSDRGIEGAVISLSGFNGITVNDCEITCGAGASLSVLCCAARDNELSGLEFAFGIPGSVGGALFMNAGAYGGEMSQVVVSARAVDVDGNLVEILAGDMQLGYRRSVFKNGGFIITDVTVSLQPGNRTVITDRMEELICRRREKQPLEYPSAGSTFKRPVGFYAGGLIEKNGLKGCAVGGAAISEKHAGFVINRDNASCADVLALIGKVQDTVFRADGVHLEPEVIFVGRKCGKDLPEIDESATGERMKSE